MNVRVKATAHVTTTAAFHGMDLDIPQEVLEGGQAVILEWANKNIANIDSAPVEHAETCVVLSVEALDID